MTRPAKKIPRKKKILITAGPTRERLDPVRFISNYSTGVFGYTIADEALKKGHEVTLVSGPVAISAPRGVKLVMVESADEMMHAVFKELKGVDCVIMAAAVCDYKSKIQSMLKMKRDKASFRPYLVRNEDILSRLGRNKGRKVLVGFALETENLDKNASKKLKDKNLDMIVANEISTDSNPFGSGNTNCLIIDRFGVKIKMRNSPKAKLAKIILDRALKIHI